ncbi:MAG: ribbon-helix-helix domain-containing protein [Nitrososphaerales archaeon]
MARNSLQAVLDQQKATLSKKSSPRDTTSETLERRKPSRKGTHLIGGHFALEVLTQLRIIAAEENTTIQNLLGEALGDLFVKKGKRRVG